MPQHPWPPIGENIARQRRLAELTQEQLAERAEVSADLVRRLEQGNRQSLLIGNLYKIANALDVTVSVLLAAPNALRPVDGKHDEASLLGLRQTLQPAGKASLDEEDSEPLPLVELQRSTRQAWRLHYAGNLTAQAAILPPLIAAAQRACQELTGAERAVAHFELSQTYQVASRMLTQLSQEDLGYLAAAKAIEAAEQADDSFLPADASNALTFVFLRQGRAREAEDTAVRMAEALEPSFGKASARQLATWGGVLWLGAVSACRAERFAQAEDLLNLMQLAAHRLGTDYVDDYQCYFGPTTVAMLAVGVAVEKGDYAAALSLSESVPLSGGAAPTTRTRYLLDVAHAQCRENKNREACITLHEVKRLAPEYLRYQVLAREIVRALLEKSAKSGNARTRFPGLRELATFLGAEV